MAPKMLMFEAIRIAFIDVGTYVVLTKKQHVTCKRRMKKVQKKKAVVYLKVMLYTPL